MQERPTITLYHFAILDFKLPDSPGGGLTLCAVIRAVMPTAKIVHITAYAGDPDIQRHVEDVHLETFNSGHAIEKSSVDWMERVVERLQSFQHTDRVGAKLAGLFPRDHNRGTSRDQFRRVSATGGSVTNRLLDLCADARIHW